MFPTSNVSDQARTTSSHTIIIHLTLGQLHLHKIGIRITSANLDNSHIGHNENLRMRHREVSPLQRINSPTF